MRAVHRARGSQLLASASVMRSTAPPSRKAGHVGSLSGHPAQIAARRTLPWSSGAAHPPGGTSRFPPSLRASTASKGRFLIPPVVPEQAQLSHAYISTTGGRASLPRGSGTASQSRSQGRAPSAPHAGSLCGPRACGTGAVPRPPAAGAAAIRAGSALGSGAAEGAGWCWGRGGSGGMRSPAWGRCCTGGCGGAGGGGCGGLAFVGCRGECTAPAGRPAAGVPRSLSPSLRPALTP